MIVLVSGFLGPSNAHWASWYWGEAAGLGSDDGNVRCAVVSCVGSAHDRACELYAQLRGCRVDYGAEHASAHGHDRFGLEDYSGRGIHAAGEWSAASPVHLVGHSFGGNTVRALWHLVTEDFWGHGTDCSWIRSVTTLTAPLKGALLTYELGAGQHHSPEAPVRALSVGWTLGLLVHSYETYCRRLGLDRLLDFGLSQWNLQEGGIGLLARSVAGGSNGAGTPAVCSMDNAANDMTVAAALAWNERLSATRLKDPHGFEFNFVARKADAARMPGREALRRVWTGEGHEHGMAWRATLFARDFWVARAVTAVGRADYDVRTAPGKDGDAVDVAAYLDSGSDGLCSGFAQCEGGREVLQEDLFKANAADMAPGQYTVDMGGDHDHFSVVPFPNSATEQKAFFHKLFATLRALPKRPTEPGNPNAPGGADQGKAV